MQRVCFVFIFFSYAVCLHSLLVYFHSVMTHYRVETQSQTFSSFYRPSSFPPLPPSSLPVLVKIILRMWVAEMD